MSVHMSDGSNRMLLLRSQSSPILYRSERSTEWRISSLSRSLVADVERVFRNLCQRSGHCAQIRPGRRWDETKRRSPCDPPLEIGLMRWFQNVITPGPHLGRGAPTQSINKTRIYEQNTRHPPGYDQAMHTASVRPARRLATWRDACEVVPKLRSLVSTSPGGS